MKFGVFSIIDLIVFDVYGNKITELGSLKNSELVVSEKESYVKIVDGMYDLNLLKFIGKTEEDKSVSDYEKYLTSQKTSITFGNYPNKHCKLIAKAYWRDTEDLMDKIVTIEIPCATIVRNIKFKNIMNEISDFDVLFEIKPFNEENDFFILHM